MHQLVLPALLRSKAAYLGAVVLFRVALELSFIGFGYSYRFAPLPLIESWALFLIAAWFLPHKFNRPSDIFVTILFIGVMLPILSLYGLTDRARSTLYITLSGYALVLICRSLPLPCLPRPNIPVPLALIAAIVGAAVTTVWFIASGATAYMNFNPREVYDFRREVGAIINVGVMGYLNVWSYKVFGTFLVAVCLLKRAYLPLLLLFALYAFWYGVSQHKAVMIYPFLIFGFWLFCSRTRALIWIPLCLTAAFGAAYAVFVAFDYIYPLSMLMRRSFIVVADNIYDYYTFFGHDGFIYWSNSITRGILDYPYELNPADLIGRWRNTGAHVNASFLATGYMHAGVLGVALYCIVTGLLFRLIDSLETERLPQWFLAAIPLVPAWSLLASADLPTALLTHGMFVALLLAYLAGSDPWLAGPSPVSKSLKQTDARDKISSPAHQSVGYPPQSLGNTVLP